MAAPKRTEFERERDLEIITSLYLTGKTQQDIAEQIGVSREQIKYDLGTIKRRWRESGLIDINEAKNRELDRIDRLEQAYWEAWQKSCGERTRKKQETAADNGADDKKDKRSKGRIRASIETETMLGNPAYLAGVESCIAERCKIIGLYAPQRQELTGKDGEPIKHEDVGLTDTERIAKLTALLNTARTRRDRPAADDGQDAMATIAGSAE